MVLQKYLITLGNIGSIVFIILEKTINIDI